MEIADLETKRFLLGVPILARFFINQVFDDVEGCELAGVSTLFWTKSRAAAAEVVRGALEAGQGAVSGEQLHFKIVPAIVPDDRQISRSSQLDARSISGKAENIETRGCVLREKFHEQVTIRRPCAYKAEIVRTFANRRK